MMNIRLLFIMPLLALMLAACAAPAPDNPAPLPPQPTSALQPTPVATQAVPAAADLSRADEQGAVEVVVLPENLDNATQTLRFKVAMNTHSVNLDMDLTRLAVLQTDTGISVTPLAWDGPSGGHHVSGTLSFPAAVNGKSLLEGATRLKLMIREVAAPERDFVWELGG